MKILVMKPKHFFRIKEKQIVILGGSLECDIECGEEVEIHTIGKVVKSKIEEIKCYKNGLPKALKGLSCGLIFSKINDLQFRVTAIEPNPYDPKTELEKYCHYSKQDNVTEGVFILKEVENV